MNTTATREVTSDILKSRVPYNPTKTKIIMLAMKYEERHDTRKNRLERGRLPQSVSKAFANIPDRRMLKDSAFEDVKKAMVS